MLFLEVSDRISQATLDSLKRTLVIENSRRISLGQPPIRSPGIIEKDKTIRGILGILAYNDQLPNF